MSKKPEVKIYPDYKFGVKFPYWEESSELPTDVINRISPARGSSEGNYPKLRELSKSLENWLERSNGGPNFKPNKLETEKKRTIHHAIKVMLGREPESQDLEKVEELGYSGNISMICYNEKPIGFCEWYREGETLFVFITPTKYFKDE